MLELLVLALLVLGARAARQYRQRLAWKRANLRVVDKGAYRTAPLVPAPAKPSSRPYMVAFKPGWMTGPACGGLLRWRDELRGTIWQTRVDPSHVWGMGWDGPPEPWIYERVTMTRDWHPPRVAIRIETFPIESVPWWWRGHEINVQHGQKWPSALRAAVPPSFDPLAVKVTLPGSLVFAYTLPGSQAQAPTPPPPGYLRD